MMLRTVTIGTHLMTLRADADLSAFQEDLVSTVQRGGGIVVVPAVGTDDVSILVTPGLPVVFRARQVPEDDSDSGEDLGAQATYWDEIDANFF